GVANALRLLQLAPEVQDLIMSGQLSAGHGKVLAAVEKVPEQLRLAQQAVKEGWSVRHLEQVVAALKRPRTRQRQRQPLTPEAAELQSHLAERLGTRVTVRSSGKRGKIEFELFGLEGLDRIVRLLLGEKSSRAASNNVPRGTSACRRGEGAREEGRQRCRAWHRPCGGEGVG